MNVYEKGKCNASRCTMHGENLCQRCKTVYYCCKECEIRDSVIHNEICHPSLDARLRAVCRIIVKYRTPGRSNHDSFDLSRNHIIRLLPEGNTFAVTAFDNCGRPCMSSMHCSCILCGGFIGPVGSNGCINKRAFFEGQHLTYDVCKACHEQKKVLCSETLMEITLCKASSLRFLTQTLFFLKEMAAPLVDDVIIGILHLLYSSMPCKICCLIKEVCLKK